MKFRAHSAAIKHLAIDPFKITSASIDGFIKIWDVLSGKCVRTLHSRYTRHQLSRRRSDSASEETANERKSIRYIHGSLHKLVATVGGEVKIWNFDPDNQLASYKRLAKKKRGIRRNVMKRPTSSPRNQRLLL